MYQTGMRCMDCGYSCHEKCIDGVPKNCTKYKSAPDNTVTQTLTGSGGDNGSVSSGKYKAAKKLILQFFLII